MAIIASIGFEPKTKRQVGLDVLPKMETLLKRLPQKADAEDVIAAVVDFLRIELDAPVKKAKAKKD